MSLERNLEQFLQDIKDATEECDLDELDDLHRRGVLPTGVLVWLKACRARVTT